MARYWWKIKQIWYYFIIMYLAFTFFYILNGVFPNEEPNQRRSKSSRGRQNGAHPVMPKAVTIPPIHENDDGFVDIFPDSKLQLNPLQQRHRRLRERQLRDQNLDSKQRNQLAMELQKQKQELDQRILSRAKITDDIEKYNFKKPKTKKRVEIISKIRWRYLRDHSVSIKDLEELSIPTDMSRYFDKIREKMNIDQAFELTFTKRFSLQRPSFATDNDRKIFLKDKDNEDLIFNQIPYEEFKGFVDIYRDGVISDKLECGHQNSRRTFMEFATNMNDIKTLDHVVCPLLIPKSGYFSNFVVWVVPKIIQAYDIIVSSNVLLLINEPLDEKILQFYDRLGIDRERLVFHKGGVWQLKTVIDTCKTPPMQPVLFKIARKAFGSSDNLTVPLGQANVVLITRENAEDGGRNIVNKAEIIGTLYNRYGTNFKVVTNTMNVHDTLGYFKVAKIIIAVHGEGLYNQILAPSGTTIVEIMPTEKTGDVCKLSGKLEHQVFWKMAAMLDQKYWRLLEEPKANCDVKVDPKKLIKVLDKIDEKFQRKQFIS